MSPQWINDKHLKIWSDGPQEIVEALDKGEENEDEDEEEQKLQFVGQDPADQAQK